MTPETQTPRLATPPALREAVRDHLIPFHQDWMKTMRRAERLLAKREAIVRYMIAQGLMDHPGRLAVLGRRDIAGVIPGNLRALVNELGGRHSGGNKVRRLRRLFDLDSGSDPLDASRDGSDGG